MFIRKKLVYDYCANIIAKESISGDVNKAIVLRTLIFHIDGMVGVDKLNKLSKERKKLLEEKL